MSKRSMRFQPHNKANKNTWKAAVYVRLSDEDKDKKERFDKSRSIENQITYIKSYIKMLNEDREEAYPIELFDIYSDDDYTGMNFARPGFIHMMNEVENDNVDCIIVKSLSRLGRYDNIMQSYMEDTFEKQNREVRFIAITDNYDSLYNEVDVMIKFKLLMNREYSENQRKNTMVALRSMQENGKYVAAFAPYGYQKAPEDKHKLIIDIEAAKVVKRIYKEFLSGASPKAIAAGLTAEGIPSPAVYKALNGSNYVCGRKGSEKEEHWNGESVKNILKKEVYTGTLVQHTRTKRKLTDNGTIPLPKEQWIKCENTHEAIISKEDWELAQNMQKTIRRNVTGQRDMSVFKGLLKCGDCEYAMRTKRNTYTSQKTGKISEYLSYNCAIFRDFGKQFCSGHCISDKTLKKIILSDINTVISQCSDLEEAVIKCREAEKTRENPSDKEILMKEKQISRLELRLKTAKNKWLDGLLKDEEYRELKEEINRTVCLLEKQIADLNLSKNNRENILENKWVQKLVSAGKLEELDRDTVLTLIDSIHVYADRHIEITYKFSDELNPFFINTI